MLEGSLVFVDIDTQRDFLDRHGLLLVPGAEAILVNLARLTTFAREQGIPVLATACAHVPGDPELDVFGPHCMVGTPGQARVEATAWPAGKVLGSTESLACSGPVPPHLTIEKNEIDVFSHREAGRIVAWYGRDRPTFVVYGVATDYCVRAAVVGLLERGSKVAVVVDAVRAIDTEHEADVLAEFLHKGALLTITEVVCDAQPDPPS
jgi:nicotinamidase/pyrazinamidase